MFLVFIENVIPFAAWTASVGGFENLFLERIPGFTLEKESSIVKARLILP